MCNLVTLSRILPPQITFYLNGPLKLGFELVEEGLSLIGKKMSQKIFNDFSPPRLCLQNRRQLQCDRQQPAEMSKVSIRPMLAGRNVSTGVNLTNILRATFCIEVFFVAFFYLQSCSGNFWMKYVNTKAACW